MIRTIVLDLDGPLLDGKLRHYRCYSDILLKNNFKPISIDDYWLMKRGCIDRHKQLEASGADGIYDVFLKAWLENIEEKKYLKLDRIQTGAVRTIETWKGYGIKIILATLRNNNENLIWQLKSLKIEPLFDEIIAVGTGNSLNKASKVRKSIGVQNKDNILWIGDTEVDISSARSLGVRICAVSCGLRTREVLMSLKPDFIIPGLDFFNLDEQDLLNDLYKKRNI